MARGCESRSSWLAVVLWASGCTGVLSAPPGDSGVSPDDTETAPDGSAALTDAGAPVLDRVVARCNDWQVSVGHPADEWSALVTAWADTERRPVALDLQSIAGEASASFVTATAEQPWRMSWVKDAYDVLALADRVAEYDRYLQHLDQATTLDGPRFLMTFDRLGPRREIVVSHDATEPPLTTPDGGIAISVTQATVAGGHLRWNVVYESGTAGALLDSCLRLSAVEETRSTRVASGYQLEYLDAHTSGGEPCLSMLWRTDGEVDGRIAADLREEEVAAVVDEACEAGERPARITAWDVGDPIAESRYAIAFQTFR